MQWLETKTWHTKESESLAEQFKNMTTSVASWLAYATGENSWSEDYILCQKSLSKKNGEINKVKASVYEKELAWR